jgi:hypothetical protein
LGREHVSSPPAQCASAQDIGIGGVARLRSGAVRLAVSAVPGDLEGGRYRQARNRDWLAQGRVPSPLALEVTGSRGAAQDRPRTTRLNPVDEPGKSSRERSAHPRRAPAAGVRARPGDSIQVYGPALGRLLARMADIPSQSSRRHRIGRSSDPRRQLVSRGSMPLSY